ncbi:hypothetical protein [Glutamicibacter sp. TV12E]|uniref:hypothetical protein n=1 Tax=Glutamicibacter sp. TV12E TaxID=3446362 RepID=UPI004033F2BB
MTNQPLNPDALEAGAKALFMRERKYHTPTLECPEPPNWEDLTETSLEHYRGNARAVLAVAQPEVNSVDELPIGTVFFDSCKDFAYQIISNGEQGPEGREIVSVGIEERYEPTELDYPLTVLQGPVK